MNIRLWELPSSFKLLISLYIAGIGAVVAFALWDAYLQTHVVYESGEEYFTYLKQAKLASLTHSHIFGHSTLFFVLLVPFLLTQLKEWQKIGMVLLAFFAIFADPAAWWLSKYVSSGFEVLSMLSGVLFVVTYVIISVAVMYELWLKKKNTLS